MVPAGLIIFLFHAISLITLFVVVMKGFARVLSQITEVIFLIYPSKAYLINVYWLSSHWVYITYGVIIQAIYANIFWHSLNILKKHNLLKKALWLQNACYFNPKATEKLDELITAEMLAAERKCCIFYQLPWDKETHTVLMSKNIVKSLQHSRSKNWKKWKSHLTSLLIMQTVTKNNHSPQMCFDQILPCQPGYKLHSLWTGTYCYGQEKIWRCWEYPEDI